MKLHAPTIALTVSLALAPAAGAQRGDATPGLRDVHVTTIAGVVRTPDGVRNNAKTIRRLPMETAGFAGRPK